MAGSHSARGRKSRGSRPPGRADVGPAAGRGRKRGRSQAARIPLRHRLPRIGDDPGDRLIGIGVILFAVGMIAVLAVFLPFWVGVNETGLLLGLAALLTVVGLGCALAGLYQQAKPRTDRR